MILIVIMRREAAHSSETSEQTYDPIWHSNPKVYHLGESTTDILWQQSQYSVTKGYTNLHQWHCENLKSCKVLRCAHIQTEQHQGPTVGADFHILFHYPSQDPVPPLDTIPSQSPCLYVICNTRIFLHYYFSIKSVKFNG